MRPAAFLAVLALGLAACGADGPPSRPEAERPLPGVSVSGSATIGVSGSF